MARPCAVEVGAISRVTTDCNVTLPTLILKQPHHANERAGQDVAGSFYSVARGVNCTYRHRVELAVAVRADVPSTTHQCRLRVSRRNYSLGAATVALRPEADGAWRLATRLDKLAVKFDFVAAKIGPLETDQAIASQFLLDRLWNRDFQVLGVEPLR